MIALAFAALMILSGGRDGDDRQSHNRPGNDCNQNQGECSDDDNVVVIVCPQGCVRSPEDRTDWSPRACRCSQRWRHRGPGAHIPATH